MDHRIPKVGVVICLVLAVGALITFFFLNSRFEGPNPVGFLSSPYQLNAVFKDNKTLPTKQAVLYRGIEVGKVTGVNWNQSKRYSTVKFDLTGDFRLRRDAVVRIGYRSLLGDPYLAVDFRGSPDQPVLKSGQTVEHTTTTVDFDEALSFLDAEGRAHVKSLIKTVADGTAEPGNGERLNGTLGGVARTTTELHTLTRTLHGQEAQIADLVRSSSTVLSTLSSREQAIRTIVSGGRTTLDALAANSTSLRQGIGALPGLLQSGRASLAQLQPLLVDAGPLFNKLHAVSPPLAAALDPKAPHSLGETVDNLTGVIRGLAPLNREAKPVLTRLKTLLDELVPVVNAAVPGARNLVPALGYLTPRSKAIAAGYALIAAATKSKDGTGHIARFALNFDPVESTDSQGPADCRKGAPASGYCRNAYPGADDSLNPQPFSGEYPRIVPCTVPSRKHPTAPCK